MDKLRPNEEPSPLGNPEVDPLFLTAKVKNKVYAAIYAPLEVQEEIRAMFIIRHTAERIHLALLYCLLHISEDRTMSVSRLAQLLGYSTNSFSAAAANAHRYTHERWEIHLRKGVIALTENDRAPGRSPSQLLQQLLAL